MSCLSCDADGTRSIRVEHINANPVVKAGDQYRITVSLKSLIYLSNYGRVCIYDGPNVIADSGSFKIEAREVLDIVFRGIMPDHDLNYKASVVVEQLGFLEACQDAESVYINVGTETIDPDDPYEPGDDDNEDPIQWIMDNIVLVLILLLVIILVLKFG